MSWDENVLILRSNGDGKLYLVDPSSFAVQGEVDLPTGIDGFGVARGPWSTGPRYYVDSSSESLIYHSEGADTWASFPNSSGTGGAGMDIDDLNGENSDLYQAASQSHHLFYGTDREDYTWETWGLPGITGEVSGFMVHDVMTLGGYTPCALIATTKHIHQFYLFSEAEPDYTLYGHEDCPLTVERASGPRMVLKCRNVFLELEGNRREVLHK